jgi:hypothetical protein
MSASMSRPAHHVRPRKASARCSRGTGHVTSMISIGEVDRRVNQGPLRICRGVDVGPRTTQLGDEFSRTMVNVDQRQTV